MDVSSNRRVKELRKAIIEYKKSGNVDMVFRIKVIISYLTNKPIEKSAEYFDVSTKTVRRWIKEYERDGVDRLLIKLRP